jgi:hypothetical protein
VSSLLNARQQRISPIELAAFAASSFFVVYGTLSRSLGVGLLKGSLGCPISPDVANVLPIQPTSDKFEAIVGQSIRRAARFVPGNHNCLSQAIAGKELLRILGRDSQIVIGFEADRKVVRFESHAWLVTDNGIVVGGEIAHQFNPVSIYSSSQPTRESNQVGPREQLILLVRGELRRRLFGEEFGGLSHPDTGIVELASSHRVTGFIANQVYLKESSERLGGVLRGAAKSQAIAGLTQVRDTVEVSSVFKEAGIRHLNIKGASLAVLSSRGMAERGGGDVDILVEEKDVPAAHFLLVNHGFSPKAAFTPMVGEAWKFWAFRDRELTYKRDQLFVDLHWRISKNGGLTADISKQLERSVEVKLGGDQVPSLSLGDALVAAAVHNYLDFCQNLRGLIDIVYLGNNTTIQIPIDTPPGGKQLLADTLEFVRGLLGDDLLQEIPGLPTPSRSGVAYLQKLWHRNSLLPLAEARSTYRGGEIIASLRHALRYGASLKEVLRFTLKVSLAFPDYQKGKKSTSVWSAFFHRAYELFSGRVPHIQARRKSRRGD